VAPVLPQIFSNPRVCTWHELALRFIPSSFEFVRCSLHHGFRSNVAADHMRLFLRHELYTSKQICNEVFNGTAVSSGYPPNSYAVLVVDSLGPRPTWASGHAF
jgi:hypothetical protein